VFFTTMLAVPSYGLLSTNWDTLNKEVTLRLFKPFSLGYIPATGGCSGCPTDDDDDGFRSAPPETYPEIWKRGEDISCTISNDGEQVDVKKPFHFKSHLPIKLMTHGFTDKVRDSDKLEFVKAWMGLYGNQVNVIMLNWESLAEPTVSTDVYDRQARNAIDVGNYVGLCLAKLSTRWNVNADNIHLLGHSLGSHLVGKAGRTFFDETGKKVGRITGLDPAGPRFWTGRRQPAIPELWANRLSKESAKFVDAIHSDGHWTPSGFPANKFTHFGTFWPVGHLDFYPDGGTGQNGCNKVPRLPRNVSSNIHHVHKSEGFKPKFDIYRWIRIKATNK